MLFAGTSQWLKINLKKDWLRILIWLIAAAGIFVIVAAKFEAIYGTPSQIKTISDTLKSPAMIALFGLMPKGHLTTANIFAAEMLVFWAILMIICNFSIAIGSSRQTEENGITELLLGGYPVGRFAPLAATALELAVINLLFMVITGGGLVIADMSGNNASGNWLLAVILGIVGWAFGMIALVFAQLVADSHTANIYSYLFFGLTYLVRMMTDLKDATYTWLSPLGWIEKTQVYTHNNWLPVFLLLLLGLATFGLALALNEKRDLNAGLLQARSGHRRSRFLRGPLTLLWYLQRTSTIIWIIGLGVLGATYGAVFDSVGKLVNTSPIIRQILGSGGVHHLEKLQLLSFLGILGMIFSLLAIIAGVMVLNHLYNDERKGFLELVQTRAVARPYLYFVYVGYGVLLMTLALIAALLGAQFAGNAVLTQPLAFHYFRDVFSAVWPIALLFIGLNAALIGILPRGRNFVWLLLAMSFMISYFGKIMSLPKWAMNLSPFYWVHRVPVDTVNTSQMWLVGLCAVALVLIGCWGYCRRDLKTN
ncbi:ABC transporter permease [Agrilactobacillus yilanensis]|uniref:ABC transporter permease n=1 Tax=Agrilactobacillus yilanensis TaxID=2485997 RepID=A0ABW4JCB6_9LACO|nr:ABC transporter permease [Agrilactobacillus yilanensis]